MAMSSVSRISKGGSRLTLLRAVAAERWQDADVLAEARRLDGAIYLAGYSVECLIKCAAGERAGGLYLDEKHETHHLDILMKDSGLLPDLRKENVLLAIWDAFAQCWGPHLRYRCGLFRERDGRLFFAQITQLYEWLWQRTR
jgi:hypothetical protein